MNGIEAAEEIGVTYRKLDYWVRSGVITPTDPGTRGRSRDFSARDMTLLRLIVLMREQGFQLKVIKFVVDCLNYWAWDPEKGPITLQVIALGHKKGRTGRSGAYTWANGWAPDLRLEIDYKAGRVLEIPGWTYLVTATFEPEPH